MMIITLVTYLICIEACSSVSSEGKCIRSLSNGETEWHCCDNKEEKNGICIDCSDGFLSESGESCHPCIEGMYGRKCAYTCDCVVYQRCNHIQGCVNYTIHVTSSTMLSDGSTYWKRLDSTTTYEPGILRTELIYIICISILIFLVVCMIYCQQLVKKRHSQDIAIADRGNKVSQHHEIGVEDDTVANQFGVYDYIDDSQIFDIMIPEINSIEMADTAYNDSGDSRSDSDENTTSLNDGYLNPYQPVLSFSNETHGYTELTNSSVDHLLTFRTKTTTDVDETENEIIETLSSSSDLSNRISIPSRSYEDGQISSYISMQDRSDGQPITLVK